MVGTTYRTSFLVLGSISFICFSCHYPVDRIVFKAGDRLFKPQFKIAFLTGISLTAIDRKGLLQDITRIISDELDLNMRAITLEASEGVGRGLIMLYVHNLSDLDKLTERLQTLEGVEQVQRV